jgi:hypothetical protein
MADQKPDIISIDMTPTWSALVDTLLEAHVNMARKRDATGCDGQTGFGWCSIHNSGYEGDESSTLLPTARCEFDRTATNVEKSVWLRGLNSDFHANVETFRQMARAADKAVEWQKAGKG